MTSIHSPASPARRHLIARIVSAIFTTIGVLAAAAALSLWAFFAFFTSGDAPANGARDQFVAFANGLPGVGDTTAFVTASNAQQPFNVDATVTLDGSCTPKSFEQAIAAVQKRVSSDDEVQVHPVVVCDDSSVQVSPDSRVTEERMTLLGRLLALPSVTAAAVTFPAPGYDRFVDDDNDMVTLAVRVETHDALVSTMRELRAHPPLGVAVPNIVVAAGGLDHGLAGLHNGTASASETRLAVSATTTTLAQLLAAIETISPHARNVSASVAAGDTSVAVMVSTAEEARTVSAILGESGADITRSSVEVQTVG